MPLFPTLEIAEKSDFPRIYEIMRNAFPPTETRSQNGQLSLIEHKYYKIYIKRQNNEIIGFLSIWEFDGANFIEHFAIDENCRSGGIGSKMLKEYLDFSTKPVFLEVEPPDNEIAARRIEFYKRLGFYLNDYEYFQPPMRIGQPPLPLKIMTYPAAIEEELFKHYKKTAAEIAYKAGIE
ncbi:MAG: GNAT family N-acetyltransferase [Oscillospiraceae bacterium]